jgi:hypothetical protein
VKDLTQGSIVSHVLTMAAPIFVGIVITMLCQLIDLYFVAGVGDAAIAGVGAAGNAGFLINAFTQVLSVGTGALVSHAVGRKDQTDANLVFNQSLGLSVLWAACALVAGCWLARSYMRSLAADEATIEAGTTYLLWFMPALALQFPLLAVFAALRGTGIVAPTMAIQALTMLINIALAPMLIAGWGTGHALGVAGAGLATSLAMVLGAVMLWSYFRWSKNYLTLDPGQLRPRLVQWKRILRVGLPAGGEFAILFIYMAVIYYALRDFGAAAQAGFGIGTRVLGLIQVPAMAIAFATGPIRRTEFRRRQQRAGPANLQAGVIAASRDHARRHGLCAMATGIIAESIYRRSRNHRGRHHVSDHGLVEPAGAGHHLPVFEPISGPRPHHAATDQFDRAARHLCRADHVAVGAARLSHRTYLVPVDRDHHAASAAGPVAAAAGVFQAARA